MPLNFVAKAALTVGLTAANMALTMTRKIEGPRLDDTKVTNGDYGAPLYMVWATRRLEVPIFFAEDLTEVKRRRKTKGGKYNEYTYYGTWAVAVAGHEVAAIRRIWFDTHLVFDLSGAGPITPFDMGDMPPAFGPNPAGEGAAFSNEHIAVYLGTETQEPDPRIQVTTEAVWGEGSCPAYRGTAYVIFKDIPLEKFGNRIPQCSVEVAGGELWPYEEVANEDGGDQIFFSSDFQIVYSGGGGGMAVYDNPTRTIINEFEGDFSGITPRFAAWTDYSFLVLLDAGDPLYAYDIYGTGTLVFNDVGLRNLGTTRDADGVWHWGAKATGSTNSYFDGAVVFDERFTNSLFSDLDGNVWMLTQPGTGGTETEVFFNMLFGSTVYPVFSVTGLDPGGLQGGAIHYRDETHDHFVFSHGDVLYAVSPEDGTVLFTFDDPHGTPAYRDIHPGVSRVWAGFYELSLADFSVIRFLDPEDHWGLSIDDETTNIYDPVNHALVRKGASGVLWLFLDRVDVNSVPLGQIAGDLAEMVGIEDHDFASLDQDVFGWSMTLGQASNGIEPLLDTYDSDIRPHDFTIQGIKRTGVTTGSSLATEWFAKEDPRYTVRLKQASELPLQIIYNYADIAADQQPNNVLSPRSHDATAAKGVTTVDMTTWVSDADTARNYADRHFRRLWNSRREVTLSLTAQQLALEPGDCRSIELDGKTDIYRCAKVTVRANDVLATEWKYDHPSLAVLDTATGAIFDGRSGYGAGAGPDEPGVPVSILSRGFFLDTPYVSDADDQNPPIIYVLGAPQAPGSWPGAIAYQAIDGDYSEELASVPSSSSAPWGTVTEELPYANPNLWDRGNVITVTLKNGELTGTTEAAINGNILLNLAAIGVPGRWEYVNFTNAELVAENTYELSGFKRGRRGTEWAAELHAANDVFVLLDTAQDVTMELSEVGTNQSFKMITAGRTTGIPETLTPYTGASLKPYAPCHLEAVKEDNGDWTLTWVRRTRVGGGWTSGTSIPLSELTEEYDLVLSNGVDDVTKVVTSPTYTWTAADQTTDVGGEVMEGDLEWTVFQISDAVDRGFAAEATA